MGQIDEQADAKEAAAFIASEPALHVFQDSDLLNGAANSAEPALSTSRGWLQWPCQVYFIMGNEICERFSFYGMRAILVVYMTDQLMMSASKAEAAFHMFTATSYLLPLFGAWLADNVLGKYRVILYLSVFYCFGHAVLAIFENKPGLAVGLLLISIGAGGIKPCVATLVGDQFDQNNQHLLPGMFAMFYWCINIGSFTSMAATPSILQHLGPSIAFAVPGIFMALALLLFWVARKEYVLVEPQPRDRQPAGFFRVALHCCKETLNRRPGEGFWVPGEARFSAPEMEAAKSVSGLLALFACLSMFQALFDQNSSTWVVQAKTMDLNFTGWQIPAAQMQAVNPVMVLILIPLFEAAVYPAAARFLGAPPRPLQKMSFGMFLAATPFVYLACIQLFLDNGHKPSILWQAPAYILLTASEVLVSTTGLQFAYTQAPHQMKSTIMSLWLLTVFVGNVLDTLILSINVFNGFWSFIFFAILMLLVAALFAFFASRYKMQDYTVQRTPHENELLYSDPQIDGSAERREIEMSK